MDFFQFNVPTRIVFSAGLARDFGAELETIPIRKYFVVTDQGLVKAGLIDPIIEGVKKAGFEVAGVFDEVPPDSGVSLIKTVAERAKASGAEGFIAVGGGSVLDTAKGANILFTVGGDLVEDYSGAQTIGRALSPLIAIPTTSGTGSEVTEAIVVLNEETQTKNSFVDRHLLPTLAILDPELTLGLPPKLTAATALDALTHAIESVMSVQRGPISDALAFQAVRLIFRNVVKAVKDGADLEARSALLVASNLAGMAFNHSMVGVVHAVAHTVGALFHVHHGTANSIFLPFGMEYNLEVRSSEIAGLAAFLNVPAASDEMQTGQAVIEAVVKLRAELKTLCGLPEKLSEVGVKEADLQTIADRAPDDGASFYNPREVNTADLLPYLKKAL